MGKVMTNPAKILVLGVGNTLYTDEGLGVRAAEHLLASYEFSENVTVLDGGTLGLKLIDHIIQYDKLIVLDAVLGDESAGSIYRLVGEDLRKSLGFNNSMHQTDLVDTLIFCELIGTRPDTVVIGMEPEDYQTMNTEISSVAAGRLGDMCEAALQEIAGFGGTFSEKA